MELCTPPASSPLAEEIFRPHHRVLAALAGAALVWASGPMLDHLTGMEATAGRALAWALASVAWAFALLARGRRIHARGGALVVEHLRSPLLSAHTTVCPPGHIARIEIRRVTSEVETRLVRGYAVVAVPRDRGRTVRLATCMDRARAQAIAEAARHALIPAESL